jgi:CubicO group peptidase (beta-lactamase class C family)
MNIANVCLIAPLMLISGAASAQQPPESRDGGPRPSPITQAELVRRLSFSLDSLSRAGRFSGVAVLAKGDRRVFEHAYGVADRATNRPNNLETAFNLGSINKVFTQIAIMQLAAAGKISLDSTLGKYWPDYPNQEVARKVTIRQLLRHTSGIGGNIFDPPAGGKRNDIRGLKDYLPLFVNAPMQFEPGARNAYSNAGYVVLGLLVERLSGEDYYTYVRKHIFEPAGMARSGSFAVDSLPPNTAIGYTRGDQDAPADAPIHSNASDLPGRGSSAGGGYSTAQDLMKFLKALRERRIANGPPAGIGVAGGSGGINSVVEGDLPGGYDLIVLSNLDPPAAERVSQMVRGLLGVRHDRPGPGVQSAPPPPPEK